MAFSLSHTLAPTSGPISPKTSGTLLLSLPSKANSRHFSSQTFQLSHTVLHSYQSVQCVLCVCVHILQLCVKPCRYLLFLDNISISMYIMCVCLFSTLSRRVGALQISIIIIIPFQHPKIISLWWERLASNKKDADAPFLMMADQGRGCVWSYEETRALG